MSALASGQQSLWDSSWYLAVTRLAEHTSWLNGPVALFSDYGIVLLAVVMLAVIYRARHDGDKIMATTLWIPLAIAAAYPANSVIKDLVAEQRPCRALRAAFTVLPCDPPTDYSFPSNHSVVVAAFAVAMLLLNRRMGLLAVIFALLMGASRVYVGAHYPHDVLAGLLVGALVAALGHVLTNPLTYLVTRLRRTAFGGSLLGRIEPGDARPGSVGDPPNDRRSQPTHHEQPYTLDDRHHGNTRTR